MSLKERVHISNVKLASTGAGAWGHRSMIVTLKISNVPTPDEIRAFLDGSQPFELEIPDRKQAYALFPTRSGVCATAI
jgi:hypothetical protein